MKVLITGGSGLVGRYVVDEFLSHGYDVTVVDLKPPRQSVSYQAVDVLNLDALTLALTGQDAVIHMAGIPHPLNDPAERVFHLNVNGTFNVLEAAARNGIRKVVFTSSESTLGFAFMTNRIVPDYFPLDELHPLRPQDPYGLSKVVGEQLCRSYSARYGIQTICLREPWIWVPEEKEIVFYRELISNYPQWYKNLWAYVHVADVACAHRLVIEGANESMHDQFFITAATNWVGIPSRDLIQRFYPETKTIRPSFNDAASLISSEKAARIFGYAPQYSKKDLGL